METWSSETLVLWMSVAMGVGAWLIARTIEAWWRGGQVPKVMSRWIVELDHAVRDLHGAEIQRAICYRRVADLIGKLPKDFDAVALTGLAMSDDIGRAILAKSEQLGIYPKGTFAKLGVVPYDRLPEPGQSAEDGSSTLADSIRAAGSLPILPPPPSDLRSNGNGSSVATPWMGSWVDGRLVPPSAGAREEN